MNAGWVTALSLGAGLLGAAFGELVSQEIRTRLDRIPQALIRLAALRLPVDLRAECTDEWLAELHEILCGNDALPITRILIGTRYALGLARTSPAIGRELEHKPVAPNAVQPPALTAPVWNARPLAPNLPPAVNHFIGRRAEMASIEEAVRLSRVSFARAPTIVIEGMAGIGKTALAVQAAHWLNDQFPDGQVFVDLHGSGPSGQPVSVQDALHAVLRQLDVPPQCVPTTAEARAALFRQRLAGTRTLVLLDSAKSAAHIKPFLDIAPGCLILVTSRHPLIGLTDNENGVVTLQISTLSDAEAANLFAALVGPGQVSTADPGLTDLVAACGKLPLALLVAAGYLRARPTMSASALASRLHLRALSGISDYSHGVETALQVAYRELTSAEQSFLRELGRLSGAEINADTAAACTGVPRQAAAVLLASLHAHGLLMESAPGRYEIHDLIRLYVQVLIEACRPEGESGVE